MASPHQNFRTRKTDLFLNKPLIHKTEVAARNEAAAKKRAAETVEERKTRPERGKKKGVVVRARQKRWQELTAWRWWSCGLCTPWPTAIADARWNMDGPLAPNKEEVQQNWCSGGARGLWRRHRRHDAGGGWWPV